MKEITQFLNSLFENIPEDLYFYVWSLPDKFTNWFQGPEAIPQAIEYVERIRDHKDVYVGCGLSKENLGLTKRTPADKISGLVGVWVDLDIADPCHKKQNLPETVDQALELIDMSGAEPTLVIHSGHGLQAWWLFKEPWIFSSENDRTYASKFTASWIYSIRERARKRNWDVDATIDLSRVFRVAGTKNHKNQRDIKPVTITRFDEKNRYDPDDLEQYILESAWEAVEKGKTTVMGSTYVADFTLDPNAEPPFSKVEALRSNDDKFAKSWEHKRKDLSDQSPSSYDMSLANIAVRAGWSDQEVVNLLIAHRRKHGQDLKLRVDYYARTLRIVKSSSQQTDDEGADGSSNDEIAEQIAGLVKLKEDPTLTSEEKEPLVLHTLSRVLQVEIKRVVKYMTDPPQLRLYTAQGHILFRDAGDLLLQSNFRRGIVNACNVVVPELKRKDWEQIAQNILDLAELEEVDEALTEFGGMRARLLAYLDAKPPEQKDLERAFETHRPVIMDGQIMIALQDDFVLWYQVQTKDRVSDRQIGATLKAMGASNVRKSMLLYGKRTTKSRWVLPGSPEDWGVKVMIEEGEADLS